MLAIRRHQAIITNHYDRTNMAILPAYEGMLSSLCSDSDKISKDENIRALGLQGVVACLSRRKSDGFNSLLE